MCAWIGQIFCTLMKAQSLLLQSFNVDQIFWCPSSRCSERKSQLLFSSRVLSWSTSCIISKTETTLQHSKNQKYCRWLFPYWMIPSDQRAEFPLYVLWMYSESCKDTIVFHSSSASKSCILGKEWISKGYCKKDVCVFLQLSWSIWLLTRRSGQ